MRERRTKEINAISKQTQRTEWRTREGSERSQDGLVSGAALSTPLYTTKKTPPFAFFNRSDGRCLLLVLGSSPNTTLHCGRFRFPFLHSSCILEIPTIHYKLVFIRRKISTFHKKNKRTNLNCRAWLHRASRASDLRCHQDRIFLLVRHASTLTISSK